MHPKHTSTRMEFVYDDGGRSEAGFKDCDRGDCVTRAIAIATEKPYREVYDALAESTRGRRLTQGAKGHHPRTGLFHTCYHPYLASLGWRWARTRKTNGICTVHLRGEDLPKGTVIVVMREHLCTVIDGTLHDQFRADRDGWECVLGCYQLRHSSPS